MNYYNEIKNKLIDDEIYSKVKDYSKERHKLETYYEVGRILSKAGKHYGDNIIKKYAEKLSVEVGKKYNDRTLRRFRQFYIIFQEEKWSTLSTKINWSHVSELLPINNLETIMYYISAVDKNNLSVRELRSRIKSKEYERLPEETKRKYVSNHSNDIKDYIKNPIVIKNNKHKDERVTEKMLHNMILENIEDFMRELGPGYSFIGSEYKIKIGDSYNYIDLLLFNIKYNCYVVIELKIVPLKKEHIGQIEIYMNYIDKNIKKIYHDKTIGLIITRKNNKFLIEYASDKKILTREYILTN